MDDRIHIIDIKFLPYKDNKLHIQEKVYVEVGAVVQWNIIAYTKAWYGISIAKSGLIFTLYFRSESPFPWKRTFVQTSSRVFSPIYAPRVIRLAEAVTETRGDFKYGVSVAEARHGKILYDDDPLLIVQ